MKIRFILTALCGLLSACSSKLNTWNVPKQITYQQVYHLHTQQNLGTVARFLYFAKPENPQQWQSAVELFFDANWQQNLADRLTLRQRVYQNLGIQNVHFQIENNSLQGAVLYPPNDKQHNWQLDVFQGKNLLDCGFWQYQYSLKFAPDTPFKILQQQLKEQFARFQQQQWQWKCYQ